MGLLVNALLSACALGSPGNSQQACLSATQAGMQQLGITQEMNYFENKNVHFLEKTAKKTFGKNMIYIISGTYFVGQAIVDKSVDFGVPTFGICDKANLEMGEYQSNLRLQWKF